MAGDWVRIANTTITNYIKGDTDNTMRKYVLSALAESRGRISYNWSGKDVQWRVRYRKHPMQGYADTESLSFPRRDRWKIATLPWRGYVHTDSITELETLKNRGAQQIIDLMGDIAKSLMDDCKQAFSEEFFIDGSLPENFKRYMGLETFFSTSGASSFGYVGLPDSVYAGLNCAPGTYGGTWSPTNHWPTDGKGDAAFDFWSPIIVDYQDDSWEAATKTWPNTCEEAISYALIKAARNTAPEGQIDVVLLENELWRQFLNRQRDRSQIYFQANASNSDLVKLGFKRTFNYDGTDILPDYGIASGIGYGLNIDAFEIRALHSTMWKPSGPDWDEASRTYRFALSNWGEFCFNPRSHFKLAPVTSLLS